MVLQTVCVPLLTAVKSLNVDLAKICDILIESAHGPVRLPAVTKI